MLVPNSFLSNALGHGAVSFPPPRQAIDGSLAPWNGKVPQEMPFMFWCASPSASAHGLDKRNVTGVNGQACFWFNNGCDISCDECDGMSGQFEDSMEEDKQIRASEQSANMASLYTAFCEAVNKNDASGIERSRNTIIEELSHKSGETLMELQARSPDYLCELSRWSSIEPFKRFLITLGRGDDVADSSYDDVKNTALVELSPKVSISVDKLQDMSIYERGAYFLPSFLPY